MGDFFLRLQALKNGTAKPDPPKEQKRIPPVSAKQKQKLKEQKPQKDLQHVWFMDRSKEMTGHCVECNKPSTKGDTTYWKFSICHILAKAIFPSVATHPLNFIELCYFFNSHHTNFDNNGYEWAKEHMPKAWPIIVARFRLIYPSIAPAERKNIPDLLLQELEPKAIIATHIPDLNTTLIEPA